MADSSSGIANAVKPDGFVDYYQLLGVPSSTGDDQLKTRINELYSEAQANRNHRQLDKRREYETLLEMLPQARNILLDDGKRARYDAYAVEARLGRASTNFSTFVNQLGSRSVADPDRVDVLGVAETPSADRKKTPATTGRKKASERARASLIGTTISVIAFFVVFGISFLVTKHDVGLAILIGALVGVIAWLVTHRPSDKIST